jgi:hypothetical protein
MTRLGRRSSLLVAFYLLTSVATAYAECAWVLWGYTTGPKLAREDGKLVPTDKFKSMSPPDPWIELAFPAYADCDKSRQRRSPEKPAIAYKEFRVTNQLGTIDDVVTYEISFRCLPDTVDPRGPKGK